MFDLRGSVVGLYLGWLPFMSAGCGGSFVGDVRLISLVGLCY